MLSLVLDSLNVFVTQVEGLGAEEVAQYPHSKSELAVCAVMPLQRVGRNRQICGVQCLDSLTYSVRLRTW